MRSTFKVRAKFFPASTNRSIVGIGRNFFASSLLLLVHFGLFGAAGSLEAKLESAWGHFDLWKVTAGEHVQGIRSFSKDKLHCNSGAYPYVGCKGGDTIVLLKWLLFFVTSCRATVAAHQRATLRCLDLLEQGARGGLEFSQGIFGHGIWLEQSCVRTLRQALQDFGAAYAHLAQFCLQQGLTLYGLVPKLHALMHFKREFHESICEHRPFTLNPQVFDCSRAEDFVGQVSKSSRRISFKRTVFERELLRRYLLKVKMAIKKFKYKRRGH